jgi:hypothetical protein
VKFKHIITKILVGKKIKPFIDLNFHGSDGKNFFLLEPFPMKILTPSKRVHLCEIIKRSFDELSKNDLQITSMSFSALLELFSIDK